MRFSAGSGRLGRDVNDLLHDGFMASALRMPEATALTVAGRTMSYAELRARALRLAATLQRSEEAAGRPLAAVYADRSETAFAGILGSLLSGRGYVPLNPHYPTAKTRQMLEQSGCNMLIVDSSAEAQLPALLDGCGRTLVVLPDRSDVSSVAGQLVGHLVIGRDDIASETAWQPVRPSSDAPAYLLFTSGSTGRPKGVMVSHRNATHFVCTAVARYGIGAGDRLSQMFDTTFDLSVFDLFVAWQAGACVCCPQRTMLWNPGSFIRDQRLTVWFSVPTVAMLMNQLGALKRGAYPSLRWSLFCGERLLEDAVMAWAAAAPSATIENLYGPTELTVACTAYRWDPRHSPAECEHGVVPIGYPLPGMQALVVDEATAEVAPGEVGELLMAGPQRTPGYWQDEAATSRAHVTVPGRADVFYRTGDRVRRPRNGGPLTFHGRVDHQIKVGGHRVELGEVEAALLDHPGVESAAAIPWPLAASGATSVAAFVTGANLTVADIRSCLRARLHPAAVPETIRVLAVLPLNVNGKVDKGALAGLLAQ